MSCLLFAQGRIGKIEKTSTSNGNPWVKFSVASSNGRKDKDGNMKTEWTDFNAFGKRADFISEHVQKGDLVSVVATKDTFKSNGKDGKTRYFTNYNVCEDTTAFQILHKSDTMIQKEMKIAENTELPDLDIEEEKKPTAENDDIAPMDFNGGMKDDIPY